MSTPASAVTSSVAAPPLVAAHPRPAPRAVRLGSLAIPWPLAVGIVAALGSRMVFWLVTDRVWEDALITVTHARNAVLGIGLTHHPGEPLTHGFTSALSVLVPLLGEGTIEGSGVVVLRVVSLLASVASLVFAYRIAQRLGLGRWPTLLVLLYLALDQNHIFYGMAGMETQLAVAILLWSIDAVMAGRLARSGLSFGLALLARPDFLIWTAAAGLDLLGRFRLRALRAAAVAAAVVAPWIAFTTWYYGSPIPQTILAKSGRFVMPPPAGADLGVLADWLGHAIGDRALPLVLTFAPFYEDTLTAAAPIPLGVAFLIAAAAWIFALIGAIRTWHHPGWRAAILFAFGFAAYRVVLLPGAYFDWYVPPHTAVLILLAAAGLHSLKPLPRVDPRVPIAAVLIVAFAMHLPFSFGLERRIQQDIEVAVRERVGERIAVLVPPGESLATESAGYYGFYSNVLMLDYPGLISKRALAVMQSLPAEHRGVLDFFAAADADWMALRTPEWRGLQREFADVAARYEVVETITAPSGSVTTDAEGRPRIVFMGLSKDASSAEILLLRKRTP